MHIRHWEVIEGRGEHILESMGEDVRRWQANGEGLADLRETQNDYSTSALSIGLRAVSTAAEAGRMSDVAKMAEDLSEAERMELVLAYLGERSLASLQAMERGTGFASANKKARVTVLEPGVLRRRGVIEEGHNIYRLAEEKPVDPGVVICGRMRTFASRPAIGGLARLEGWGTNIVTGLVSPQTGEPRVKLEILAKR